MSMFFFLKNPQIRLLADGELTDEFVKTVTEMSGGAIIFCLSGQKAVLPMKADCNVAYIREAKQEEVDEFHKKRAEEMKRSSGVAEGGIISKPQFMFPGGIKGKG